VIYVIESEAHEELKNNEYEAFKDNAELKAIIAGQRAKKLSIMVGDIEIFIRGALPKGLRDQIVRIAKAYQAGDTENADEEIYDILSQICIDSPYNKAEAWRYLDEETGAVPDLLYQIVDKITDVETSAKRFRRKQ
jgi:hypothetical protein